MPTESHEIQLYEKLVDKIVDRMGNSAIELRAQAEAIKNGLHEIARAIRETKQEKITVSTNSRTFSLSSIGLFLFAAGGAATAYYYFNKPKASVMLPDTSAKQGNEVDIQANQAMEGTATPSAEPSTQMEGRALPAAAAAQITLFSSAPPRSPSPLHLASQQDSPIKNTESVDWWPSWGRR